MSLIGGALGLIGSVWTVDLISGLKPPIDFALETAIAIDWRVLVFSAAVSVFSAVLLGLMPAWQATRTDLVAALKNDRADARARRWPLRDVMVGAQIALSVVLLVASGLMLRSLQHALTVDIGFNPRHAATVGFDLGIQGYSEEKGQQFLRDLSRWAKELPGVKSMGVSSRPAYRAGLRSIRISRCGGIWTRRVLYYRASRGGEMGCVPISRYAFWVLVGQGENLSPLAPRTRPRFPCAPQDPPAPAVAVDSRHSIRSGP